MPSLAKGKREICQISFTFPITMANENVNLAGAQHCQNTKNVWMRSCSVAEEAVGSNIYLLKHINPNKNFVSFQLAT
jgi:hypothetical protein